MYRRQNGTERSMADDTPHVCGNMVIYSVYIRNHGPGGTFADVEDDLPRIRSMGADAVWFMPIHPIGKNGRKGSLGSPYSISDYRGVNPEYGTRDDFGRLIERSHALGMKVMIDVVYNHTSRDSALLREHPEFFHMDAEGKPVSTVPDWSDVIDLRHPDEGLSGYLIDTLAEWARFGVDGFRCDVASLVPLRFWRAARKAVAAVKPGVLWLAESVHAAFVNHRRSQGLTGVSDAELYSAFDITYDYDLWAIQQAAMAGVIQPRGYLEMLRFQEAMLPAGAVKLRFTENHDQARTSAIIPDAARAKAWTAFAAFNRGAFLVYAGQESGGRHTPSLFERDPVEWGDRGLQDFLTRLSKLKKADGPSSGRFVLIGAEPAAQAAWTGPASGLYGVFNLDAGGAGSVPVKLPDGVYHDALNDGEVRVRSGRIGMPESAVIIRFEEASAFKPFDSTLMDYGHPLS
jgi:glycosidase